jgi:hypothetical protein
MEKLVGAAAASVGYALRFVLWLVQIAVYAAGPLLVWYGLMLIYRPASYIAVGLILSALMMGWIKPRGTK